MSTSHPAPSAAAPQRRVVRRSEAGATLVEYAFLVALIAVVCISAVVFLGEENSASLDDSASKVGSAIN